MDKVLIIIIIIIIIISFFIFDVSQSIQHSLVAVFLFLFLGKKNVYMVKDGLD